jgi:type II secretory pathway pseudopilin PulG
MTTRSSRRPAFTLIELLVVLGIILTLTALVVVAIPSVGDRNMQQAADKLQGQLFIVKARAKSDRLPTGLRFEFDPSTNQCTSVIYVQQPEDFWLPKSTMTIASNVAAANITVTFFTPGVPRTDLKTLGVQAGDWLELFRGGGVYMIQNVGNLVPGNPTTQGRQTLTLVANRTTFPYSAGVSTADYRIFRQAVPIVGEEPVDLPDGVVVDNTNHPWTNAPRCHFSTPAATGTDPNTGFPYFDVLFAPQGGLVGRGSGTDKIYVIWLSNIKNSKIGSNLITIQAHTGLIAVQPENSNPNVPTAGSNDPYFFTRDIRSSGL